MDGHVILNTQGVLDSAIVPAKGIRTGCPTHPPMVLLAMVRERYKSVGLLLGIKRLPGDPLLLRVKAYIYSFRGTVPLINGEEIFYVVMMTIGVMGCGPWLLVVIACKTRFTLIDHQTIYIRMAHADYPDVLWRLSGCLRSASVVCSSLRRFWFGFVVRNGSKKDCFICPDLVNEEAAMPTEKGEENVILFTKEQFNAGLRFPLPALFKEFLHFSQIPPIFIHPNLVRVLMGCSIINMLYSLDLTLLEVFFVYSLKKAKMISSVCPPPALPSNGDRAARFDKGRGEGAGGGPGWMGGLSERASGIEGPPCGLGGKGVLRLCLQIIRDRSQGEGLQDIAFRAEFDSGRPGVPGICYQYSPQETGKG
ncbi:hypothetical protein CK203_029128 [Vitis vinifera]|uniref:Uncharacterized protein n=1 Tax=Vitis vinifera TaxID=29760 RepID=A0A438IT37_VITVI|nr:hypothetical protein CK203_029128 [Vitis vinifera]